jgi:hypothetical protein
MMVMVVPSEAANDSGMSRLEGAMSRSRARLSITGSMTAVVVTWWVGEGRQQRHRRHDDRDHAREALAGQAADPGAERLRDAGLVQRPAHDEDRHDHDRRLAAEAGQRLVGLEQAAETQREDDQQRH